MKLARMHQKLLLALIVMIAAYFPTILWMYDRWIARDSYYSHGFLIPIVSLALIYWNKEELAEIKWKESPWGMRLIIAGAVLHLLASHPNVRIYFVSGFSMLVLICGLVLYLYGEEIFRRILFPLFFLIFMVPMPLVVINKISLQLKMFAAELATMVLNNMGIQALRDGSIIKMRHAHVTVDDVCSGLRSLISLTALGSICAYWLKAAMWKRLTLFASTIPIAIITNMCRVVALSAISEIWGTEYAEGFVHDFLGFMVFALAFIMLMAVGKLLE
ncbi:MAG: exosortase/archaeosortase family protein [Candidatus Omnitrophica bacterium]|nr:exosortase/archaeosortase family protein [Candidatus Omnitrophota bacterium]MCB9721580.1 exosortase/archaeosortase family protein [Candidatus Omnitrophota bacterium]